MKIALIKRWGSGVPAAASAPPAARSATVLTPVGRLAIRDAVDEADAVLGVLGEKEGKHDADIFRDECLVATIRAAAAGKRVALVAGGYWRSYPLADMFPPSVSLHATVAEAFAALAAAQ